MGHILTSSQCRGARAMLDWSQSHLAATAGVSRQTIVDFERGTRTPYRSSLATLRAALEEAGVEFMLEDDRKVGVWLRPQAPKLSPYERAITDLNEIARGAIAAGDWGPTLQDRIEQRVDLFVNCLCATHAGKPDSLQRFRSDLDHLEWHALEAWTQAEGTKRDFWSVVLDLIRTQPAPG